MDEVDRAILRHLQDEGRLSNIELAHRVGLSPSPCLRRVHRLEAEGVIKGYRAVVSPEAAGRVFEVTVMIDLSPMEGDAVREFEAGVQEIEDVVECHRMFGTPDYILKVAVQDIAAYERLYSERLSTLPWVSRIASHIAMKTVKAGGGLPI